MAAILPSSRVCKLSVACSQSGERSTARGLALVHQRLVAERQRLQASGAERLLDVLLQTMAANRDLEPEELDGVRTGISRSHCFSSLPVASLRVAAFNISSDVQDSNASRLQERAVLLWLFARCKSKLFLQAQTCACTCPHACRPPTTAIALRTYMPVLCWTVVFEAERIAGAGGSDD